MNEMSEGMRCFIIIALTTTIIAIFDLIAHALFFEQAQRISPFLPLLIGSIALCVMGIRWRNRNKPKPPMNQPNASGARRVRVTGPVK